MSTVFSLRRAALALCIWLPCTLTAVLPCTVSAAPDVPAAAVPATPAAPPTVGMQDAELMPAIFYYKSRGFMLTPPPGWWNNSELAHRVRVDAFFVPQLMEGQRAQGSIYLRLCSSQGRGEEAVNAQTTHILGDMARRFPGTRPVLEKGEGGTIASGQPFYLRRINQAPAPHSWESIVYLESDGVLLSLVLTCRSAAARQMYESVLLHMAKDMTMLEVKSEK